MTMTAEVIFLLSFVAGSIFGVVMMLGVDSFRRRKGKPSQNIFRVTQKVSPPDNLKARAWRSGPKAKEVATEISRITKQDGEEINGDAVR